MPRVVQRAGGGGGGPRQRVVSGGNGNGNGNGGSPLKGGSPVKIPLNDDTSEKAARLQSRHALHDLQMNQIKAAASPMRKLNNYDRAASSSPKTPTTVSKSRGDKKNARPRDKENDGIEAIPLDFGMGAGVGVGGVDNVRAGDHAGTVTPMKRVPILANFEEWMKMATDNKINATNSWNFALIDYFHDMSLLKEGDGVNFQKASCTLDGCVKIYTSRVDSVATETGKLLSGLADSGNTKKGRRGEGEEGEEGEEDGEDGDGEDGEGKRRRKKTNRAAESTLAPSFASLQLKKFELEFGVDPLFKKASADFDEGGAKGLLLNHLAIDGEGRIVFDSSDDVEDGVDTVDANAIPAPEQETEEVEKENGEEGGELGAESSNAEGENDVKTNEMQEDGEIDIAGLGLKFFPDLNGLDEMDICASLKTFNLGDPTGSLDIPFLRAPEDWRDKPASEVDSAAVAGGMGGIGDRSGIMIDDDNAAGFDDDASLGAFDMGADAGFGEGGETWAKEAALEPMLRVQMNDGGLSDGNENVDGDVGGFDPASDKPYAVSLTHGPNNHHDHHENILAYFDNALRKDWAGPEHWKIRRVKEASNTPAPTRQRKEKEPFEIDFRSPLTQAQADAIYIPAASNASISLPKKEWRSKTRNLLPDDKHFNSAELLKLFLKPRAKLGSRKLGHNTRQRQAEDGHGPLDEGYWASRKNENGEADDPPPVGDYDADFFNDDDGLPFVGGLPDPDDDDNFADAREAFSPPAEGLPGPDSLDAALEGKAAEVVGASAGLAAGVAVGGFGAQLVTQGGRRLRPEYVNYARVAKKVDVRRLKENLWKSIEPAFDVSPVIPASLEQPPEPERDPDAMDIDDDGPPEPTTPKVPNEALPGTEALGKDQDIRFTDLMNGLQTVYPPNAMRDISTSYCFICLLHLANEKGLVLQSEEGLEEIMVMKDREVGKDYIGE